MAFVYEAINMREGGLIVAYLAGHGVPAEVVGGNHHSVRGELYNLRGMLPQVHILDDRDLERAKALLADYEAMLKTGVAGEPWTCPQCGESLEPQFQSCWRCQTDRPA